MRDERMRKACVWTIGTMAASSTLSLVGLSNCLEILFHIMIGPFSKAIPRVEGSYEAFGKLDARHHLLALELE
jgi:hypothetical protein